MRKIVKTTLSHDIICKHCRKPAKLFWYDENMQSGVSECFYRDMHAECYELVYGKKDKTLEELNNERKHIQNSTTQ